MDDQDYVFLVEEFRLLLDDLLREAELGLQMIVFLQDAKIKAGILDKFEKTLQSLERNITTLTRQFQGVPDQDSSVPAFRDRFEVLRLRFLAIKKDFPGPLVQ